MKPKRVQRRRTAGWKKPEGAVYVGRPGRWGNPFPVRGLGDGELEEVLRKFRDYATDLANADPGWLEPLRGKDLMCWCRLGRPCHADVLLELANA